MISDTEREKIKKEAKEILEKFSTSLKKVKLHEEKKKEEVGGFRKEGEGIKADTSFKKLMFQNAPRNEEGYIIAERKKW